MPPGVCKFSQKTTTCYCFSTTASSTSWDCGCEEDFCNSAGNSGERSVEELEELEQQRIEAEYAAWLWSLKRKSKWPKPSSLLQGCDRIPEFRLVTGGLINRRRPKSPFIAEKHVRLMC